MLMEAERQIESGNRARLEKRIEIQGIAWDWIEVPDSDFVEPVQLSKLGSGRYDWMVMGAFSRPRIRETLFGGVTKRMLKESPVPLLIAH